MKVAIIGAGVVGQATAWALQTGRRGHSGHTVDYFDPARGMSDTAALSAAECTLVCVPTPFDDDEAIQTALSTCSKHCKPDSIVAIKSTVAPGFTEAAQQSYPKLRVLFCPEFLTQATADHDAAHPARQIVGYARGSEKAAKWLLSELPPAPFSTIMPATDAELAKYFSNCFFATKVAFANLMFDLCEAVGGNYRRVRDAAEADPMIASYHLDVHHRGYRGYSGKCLPKDLHTLISVMHEYGDIDRHGVLDSVDAYNDELLTWRICGSCGVEYEEDPDVLYDQVDACCGDCYESVEETATG